MQSFLEKKKKFFDEILALCSKAIEKNHRTFGNLPPLPHLSSLGFYISCTFPISWAQAQRVQVQLCAELQLQQSTASIYGPPAHIRPSHNLNSLCGVELPRSPSLVRTCGTGTACRTKAALPSPGSCSSLWGAFPSTATIQSCGLTAASSQAENMHRNWGLLWKDYLLTSKSQNQGARGDAGCGDVQGSPSWTCSKATQAFT